MRDDKDFDTLIRNALSRSGEPAPFPVDVASRVMARVAALGPPPRTEMSGRQFGRWAVAASVAGAALTLAAFWNAPSLAGALSFVLHTLADGTGAALKLAGPASSIAGTLGRVAIALISSTQTFVRPLLPLQPLAQILVAASMLSITTIVLSRDLRSRIAVKERA